MFPLSFTVWELMSKEVTVKLQVGYLGDEKEKYHFQSSEL